MKIDFPTLMFAGSFIATTSGIFLTFAWLQNRDSWALLWWAAANLLLAVSVPLLVTSDAAIGAPSQILAMTLLNISPAMIWAAARNCNNQRANRPMVFAGASLWLVAFLLPGFRTSTDAQVFLNLSIVAMYLFAAGAEFWSGRAERLGSRWPLIVLLFCHGFIFVIGAMRAIGGDLPLTGSALLSSWYGFVHFESFVFVVGTAIFVVAIDRERSELRHKILASIDQLTGVATRASFFDKAEHLLDSCRTENLSYSLIVFDLDRFKEINDTHGHLTGDRVLEVFGDTARAVLGHDGLVGRPGGEEFAVAIPGADAGAAYVLAERIRVTFSQACSRLGTLRSNPTVSGGIATAEHGATLQTIYAAADRALYVAKKLGRDRVEMGDRRGSVAEPGGDPAVAMVA